MLESNLRRKWKQQYESYFSVQASWNTRHQFSNYAIRENSKFEKSRNLILSISIYIIRVLNFFDVSISDGTLF